MSPSPPRLTRRGLLTAAAAGGAAAGLSRAGIVWATSGPGSYTASWSSADQHPPAPDWFQDAKFGIYYHWGVFSVPAFQDEWYPRKMYIPSGQQTILRGMGDWLHRFGEAIYATRPWSSFGERPTQMGGGSFSGPREGTNRDIRFTRSKDNTVLYATVLGGTTGWSKIANATSGLVLDSGGNVASGSGLKQWSYDGSTNLQWQLIDLGTGYYRIVNRTNGMVADSWGNSANGAVCMQAPWNGGNNQQWRLNSVGSGRYQIVNRGTGTALDGMGYRNNGDSACMWTPNGSTNNEWTITGV